MKMFTGKFAQYEVTQQRLRISSKNPTLAARPARRETRHSRGKAAAIFTRGAYAEYVSTARTPLAAFFNRPIMKPFIPALVVR